MRALCISKSWIDAVTKINRPTGFGPEYGEIVTISGKYINNGISVYTLVEYPMAIGGFAVEKFIPISDIDETEMSRDYNVVKALFP